MNFEFIKDFKDFSQLYRDCSSVETLVINNPKASVSLARVCNEYIIKFIYSAKVGDISTYTAYDLLIKDQPT
jgi:hypothetical protein